MNEDWIKISLVAAKAKHDTIPATVVESIEKLLTGVATEKELKTSELSSFATELLTSMGAARQQGVK